METKIQEATINRPDGERVIDAPYVVTDLERFATQIRSEEAWKRKDYNSMTIYKTSEMTVVLSCLHPNASIANNAVDGFLTVQVLDGTIDFSVDKKTIVLEKNQMITLHPQVLHSIRAQEDCTILMTNMGS